MHTLQMLFNTKGFAAVKKKKKYQGQVAGAKRGSRLLRCCLLRATVKIGAPLNNEVLRGKYHIKIVLKFVWTDLDKAGDHSTTRLAEDIHALLPGKDGVAITNYEIGDWTRRGGDRFWLESRGVGRGNEVANQITEKQSGGIQ